MPVKQQNMLTTNQEEQKNDDSEIRNCIHLIETNWSEGRFHNVSNRLARHHCPQQRKAAGNRVNFSISERSDMDGEGEGTNHSGCGRLGQTAVLPRCRASEQRSPLRTSGGSGGEATVKP